MNLVVESAGYVVANDAAFADNLADEEPQDDFYRHQRVQPGLLRQVQKKRVD